MYRTLIATILFCILASVTVHAESSGLVVYRDSAGDLTQQSRKNLPRLVRMAGQEGTITIWVVFDIPFEGNPELRTAEVVALEAAAKQAAFSERIAPLIERELAYEIETGIAELNEAPGSMLEITAAGLMSLARDPGIKHISHVSLDQS